MSEIAELVGVTVFALSGGLIAARCGLDIFGAVVLALSAGLGGGIIRDVLLGQTPPANLGDAPALVAATLAGALGYYLHLGVGRFRRTVLLLDAGGLGLFTVNGAVTALVVGTEPVTAVAMGLITGTGGGVLRDVLARQVPVVLQDDVYALPALLGSATVVLLWTYDQYSVGAGIAVAAAVVLLRLVGRRRGWHHRLHLAQRWPQGAGDT